MYVEEKQKLHAQEKGKTLVVNSDGIDFRNGKGEKEKQATERVIV